MLVVLPIQCNQKIKEFLLLIKFHLIIMLFREYSKCAPHVMLCTVIMKSLVLIQFEFKGLVAPYNAQPRPCFNFISRLENDFLESMAKNNPNTALLWGYQSHYHLLTLNL
jgi:hypothetical protein